MRLPHNGHMTEFHHDFYVAVATVAPVLALTHAVLIGQIASPFAEVVERDPNPRGRLSTLSRQMALMGYYMAAASFLMLAVATLIALKALGAGQDFGWTLIPGYLVFAGFLTILAETISTVIITQRLRALVSRTSAATGSTPRL